MRICGEIKNTPIARGMIVARLPYLVAIRARRILLIDREELSSS